MMLKFFVVRQSVLSFIQVGEDAPIAFPWKIALSYGAGMITAFRNIAAPVYRAIDVTFLYCADVSFWLVKDFSCRRFSCQLYRV